MRLQHVALCLGLNIAACSTAHDQTPENDLGMVADASPVDALAADMGFDANLIDMEHTPDLSVPSDLGSDMAVMHEPCDPYDATSCPDDATGARKCGIVRRSAGAALVLAYECVPATTSRDRVGLDIVCAPFSRPLSAGESYDPCRQGLNCAPDPSNSALSRCQEMCGGMGAPACAVGEYCNILNAEEPTRFGVCIAASGCDAVEQTGCPEGQGCYWVFGGDGSVIGDCQDPSSTDGGPLPGPGDACTFTNDCAPGTQCFPSTDGAGASLCYELCDPTAETTFCAIGFCFRLATDSGVDAGVPDPGLDAGVSPTPPGICRNPFGT